MTHAQYIMLWWYVDICKFEMAQYVLSYTPEKQLCHFVAHRTVTFNLKFKLLFEHGRKLKVSFVMICSNSKFSVCLSVLYPKEGHSPR